MTEQMTGAAPTRDAVRGWLVARVAHYLEEPPEAIDAEADLARYGLESVYAFALCGEIDEAWGVNIEPSHIWDVENLAELADLVVEAAGAPPSH
ncbi:acyl carrier protein [Dactylosporangium sp. NPDC049742]|uniref:acyl carrier protein n=1 Tax=Dactylosporangium sp. NPDC049742 TaxID=3154737 RepID=UPI003437BAE5